MPLTTLEAKDILNYLPHRYPFLLVDRIVEIAGAERIVGIKNVSFNEPFFQGHFPDHPVMPGVLICESIVHKDDLVIAAAPGNGVTNQLHEPLQHVCFVVQRQHD